MWETPLFCPLKFSGQFSTNTSGFNSNWMLHQIHHEILEAQKNLKIISNETALFLSLPKPTEQNRQRSGTGAVLAPLFTV